MLPLKICRDQVPAAKNNWELLAAITFGAFVLWTNSKSKAAPTPRFVLMDSGHGQSAQGSRWPLFAIGGIAAVYGGTKVLNHVAAAQNRTPAPLPPVPDQESLAARISSIFLQQPEATWTPPIDTRWLTLAPHPSVVLVLGKRGSGKSALGYRLLELFRNRAAPYVVGIPAAARKLLPDWVGCVDRLEDAPPGATVLLDEAYLQYHARDSMSGQGRDVGAIINLSRQRDQSLVFVVQEARQLDVNAISQADVIAIKELSEISREFERPQLRRFTDKARVAFTGLNGNQRQRSTWVYSEAAGEAGLVENELASFWKPGLSRAFAQGITGQATTQAAPTKGAKTPREELRGKVKALRHQGHSFGEIGTILGISKTLAFTLNQEADPPL